MSLEVIRYLQSFSSPFMDMFAQGITMLGEDTLFILLAVILIWCVDKKFGYKFGFVALTSALVNITLKNIFKSPRPVGQEGIRSLRLETADGYSFPSGHSQFAATSWTTLALHLRKRWFSILAGVLIVLVGLSRLYLGVHWPVDVVFGIAIGAIWAFLGSKIIDLLEEKPVSYLVLGAALLLALPIFQNADYFKVVAACSGICIGIFLEGKYVGYTVKAPLLIQLIKALLGVAVLLGIQNGLKLILPDKLISHGLRYFLIGIWATFLAPLCFKAIFKLKNQVEKSAS